MTSNDEAYRFYKITLGSELRQNLKPVIHSLTMLAEDYSLNADSIVKAIEDYINEITPDLKILGLYLMDSIIKNLKESVYVKLFQDAIVSLFSNVFELVDEDNRRRLYKLRLTWNDIFSNRTLYSIDISVNNIDPAWPINAKLDNLHISSQTSAKAPQPSSQPAASASTPTTTANDTQKVLQEVMEQRKKLREEQIVKPIGSVPVVQKPVVQQQQQQIPQQQQHQLNANTIHKSNQEMKEKPQKTQQLQQPQQQNQQPAQDRQTNKPSVVKNDVKIPSRDPRLVNQQAKPQATNLPTHNNNNSNAIKIQKSPTTDTSMLVPQKKPMKRVSPTPNELNIKKPKMTIATTPATTTTTTTTVSPAKSKQEQQVKRPVVAAIGKSVVSPKSANNGAAQISPPQAVKKLAKTLPMAKAKTTQVKARPTESKDLGDDIFGNEDIDYRSKGDQQTMDVSPPAKTSTEKADTLEHNLALLKKLKEEYKNTSSGLDLIKMVENLISQKTSESLAVAALPPPLPPPQPQVQLTQPPVTITAIPTATNVVQPATVTTSAPSQKPQVKPQIPSLFDIDVSPAPSTEPSSVQHTSTDLPPIKLRDKHDMEDSLLTIDGRSYRIQPDQRRIIKIYYHDHEIYCDTRTKDVYVDSKRVYKMGDSTKEIMLNGRRVRLMYMGKRVELWIDTISFHFRADSPPKQITLTSPLSGLAKRYYVTIDGRTMDMFFNNYKVCNLNAGLKDNQLKHTVKLAPDDYEMHEISFVCPPKRIMIDDQLRTMRYDLPIPCMEIDSNFYIIRFTGSQLGRDIYIDDIAYRVPFDKTTRIKLNGRAHELAWGGPGYEVIIDGRAYEIQFGATREVYIGARQHFIRISGDAPDVRICGRLPDDILQQYRLELHEKQQTQQQATSSTVTSQATAQVTTQLANLNPQDIVNKLIKHGLLPKTEQQQPVQQQQQQQHLEPLMQIEEPIPDLTGFDTSLLKQKHNQAIQNLYGGIQCGTCGMRFTNEQSNRYSKHYDWHFRQNKKEKEEANMAHSRAWYYDLYEWIQYEELSEDLMMNENAPENSGTGHVDNQTDADKQTDTNVGGGVAGTNQNDLNRTMSNAVVTCAATSDIDDFCSICKDPFDIFWDEDKEEWHFKDALRVGNKVYHPVCFEDAKEDCQSSVPSTPCVDKSISSMSVLLNANDTVAVDGNNESILFENPDSNVNIEENVIKQEPYNINSNEDYEGMNSNELETGMVYDDIEQNTSKNEPRTP